MANSKPILDYVESQIVEFCNLNCKGCGAFVNLSTKKSFYKLDEFTKDYHRMAEIFAEIQKIRLLGGEPLLNPKFTEYIRVCRELFPSADIRIVTNGLLIPKLDDSTLLSVKELDCKFDISNYPTTRKMFHQIKARLKPYGIEYDLGIPMDLFFRNILDKPSSNAAPAFNNCVITHCHNLSHGKLSPCTLAHSICRLNAAFGTEYPETDYIDIYSDVTGEQILQYFSHPHEFCKYCSAGLIPFKWKSGVSREKAKLNDWIVKDNAFSKIIVPPIQKALKKPAMWIRSEVQKK